MQTEIEVLPCATVKVRVCTDESQTFCATAFTSSQHLIPDKEVQLKALLEQRIEEDKACA